MPRFDRTGPQGMGAKSGKEMGRCSGYVQVVAQTGHKPVSAGGIFAWLGGVLPCNRGGRGRHRGGRGGFRHGGMNGRGHAGR